jgi:hypothetical protein
MTATALRAPRRAAPLLLGLVLGTIALALAGAALAAGIIRTGDPAAGDAPALPAGPFGLAEDIPASFGVVAVEHVDKVSGTTSKQVGGMTHGISGFVRPDQQQIQASVTLTNLTAAPVAYTPGQFRLLAGGKPVTTFKSSFEAGELQPYAAIEGRLTYVAPRKGAKLELQFRDPGRSAPITIELGRTGRTPAGALDRFDHHRAGRGSR